MRALLMPVVAFALAVTPAFADEAGSPCVDRPPHLDGKEGGHGSAVALAGDDAALSSCTGEPLIEAPAKPAGSPPMTVISNCAAVTRGLTPSMAAELRPVCITGVVLLQDGASITIFGDVTSVFISARGFTPETFERGDIVEVQGVTYPGKFRNHVHASRITRIGKGKIPGGRDTKWDDYLTIRMDAFWVKTSGVVRRIDPELIHGKYKGLILALGGGRLSARLPKEAADGLSYGATVQLTGVVFYQFNKASQVLNPVLVVPSAYDIIVYGQGPANPFAQAPKADSLRRNYRQDEFPGKSILLHGVVTHAEPGEGFWIRERDRGVQVKSWQCPRLLPGDKVDVSGFLSFGYSFVLEDAVFRKTGFESGLKPVRLKQPSDALNHDSDLVELEAVLQAQETVGNKARLKLAAGTSWFDAELKTDGASPVVQRWRPGSLVRVRGICLVDAPLENTFNSVLFPKSFRILLRGTDDLVVLQEPSWWTPQRISTVMGLFAAFLMLTLAVVMVAVRLRLRREAAERRQAQAMEQERARIARDMHDDLGAGLTQVSLDIAMLQNPVVDGDVKRGLMAEIDQRSRDLVRSLDEIVWAVNPRNDTVPSMARYFSEFAQNFLVPAGITCRLEIDAQLPGYTVTSERRHELFLAFKEALNNVVRHSGATEILLGIGVDAGVLMVRLRDNGHGFEMGRRAKEGADGLENMVSRLTRIGGRCSVKTVAGRGTDVVFTLPLGDEKG